MHLRLIRKCAKFIAGHASLFTDHAVDDAGVIPDVDRIWMKGKRQQLNNRILLLLYICLLYTSDAADE